MALSREQFAWQQAQAAAAAAAKSSVGSPSGSSKGRGKDQSTEKYTSSTAMRIVHDSETGVDQSLQGRINALEAMYEAGNITKKQYSDLVYALKNPGR